jgi:hypothetical protein
VVASTRDPQGWLRPMLPCGASSGWVSILMGVDVTKVASACWSKDEGPGWAGC